MVGAMYEVSWEPVDEVEVEFTNDVKYPEEVRLESIEALLKREMAKGKVIGHFC